MSNKIKQELNEMKYLFGYERGRVISEQNTPIDEYETEGDIEVLDFDPEFAGREVETPVRPDVDTPTKPSKPGTPYRPKPGPKKNPKAGTDDMMDVDMPNWLSFDELGLNFED